LWRREANKQKFPEGQVYNVVNKAYPNFEILSISRYRYYHSDVGHITILDKSDNEPKELLLKKYHSKPYSQTLNEYTNQGQFYSASNKLDCTTPKPILIDAETNAILMQYVRGASLKSILLSNETLLKVEDLIDSCADILYLYHNVFTLEKNTMFSIDCPILGGMKQEKILSVYNLYDDINLKTVVRPFLDFSPWNILFSDGITYLIDFPESNCVCTPHIDIARFIFCMNIIKHTPNVFRLKLQQDWDQYDACNRFMAQYSKRQKVKLNDDDLMLIKFFYKEHAKTLMRILKSSPSIVEKLQYFYLNKSIYNGINRRPLGEKMVDLGSRLSEMKRRGSEQ
jgi:hypothetical protein